MQILLEKSKCLAFLAALYCFFALLSPIGKSELWAQIDPPDNRYLFTEDSPEFKKARKATLNQATKSQKLGNTEISFNSPKVEYLQDSDEIRGSDGVLISREGLNVQAKSGTYSSKSRKAKLAGDVNITSDEGSLSASSAEINLDTECGVFTDAAFTLEEGGYGVKAKSVERLSETEYRLIDADLSTCHCKASNSNGESADPWTISANSLDIEQDGYAYAKGMKLKVLDIPVFYTPYFIFPAKLERQSGLLRPEFGHSSSDGLKLKLPFFITMGDSADITISPFTETKTRTGLSLDLRSVGSRQSKLDSRIYFSDESARDGSLRGTETAGLADPTFDEKRFAGFLKSNWQNDNSSSMPLSFLTDVHYVSDDLFLREIDDRDIGESNSRFTTSRAVLRSSPIEWLSTEAALEYNQSLEIDDDLVFQRLPELGTSALKSFRIFGSNPYGLKLVSKIDLSYTSFVRGGDDFAGERVDYYDGQRLNVNPELSVPFHISNYVNGSLGAGAFQTKYWLDDTSLTDNSGDLDDSNSRSLPYFTAALATGFERVFELDQDSWFKDLLSWGREGRDLEVKRLKHTIQPYTRYTYVPEEEQDDLPLFDSLDRVRARSLVTYGVRSTLLGRFDRSSKSPTDLYELTPRISDIGVADLTRGVGSFGSFDLSDDSAEFGSAVNRGQVNELLTLTVKQSYDYEEAQEDRDPNLDAFSDVGTELVLLPSNYVRLKFESNIADGGELSSWGSSVALRDDRGDVVRTRYSYIREGQSQIDGNIELPITERVRLGYYAKYDDQEAELLENRFGFRFVSSCDCWKVDLGYVDRVNPDKQQYTLTFSMLGLGDFGG